MNGSQQSDGACHGSESGNPPQQNFIPIAELPPGLIVFSATPKLLVTRKSRQIRRHRKLVKPHEIDNLSGLMTKLGVKDNSKDKKNEGAARRSESISQVSSTGSARLFRRARRKGTKASTVSLLRDYQLSDRTPSKDSAKIWGFRQIKLFAGATSFEKCTGLWRVPFVPVLSTDRLSNHNITTRHQCISAMKEYSHLSPEEIRFEDYISGKKDKLYTSNNSPKFHSPIGSDVARLQGQMRTYKTRHKCISAMPEYEERSFEEIRLEQYMPSTSWKHRNELSLPKKEIEKLQISIDSEVYIFLNTSGSANEAEKGKVRFIGRLPDKPRSEIHVGVELDRPVGLGNGCYKNVRLFRTEKSHAEILSLDSALPIHLYNGKTTPTEAEAESIACSSLDPTSTSESKDNDAESDKANKCSVCWTFPVNMFFHPCGHVCCCERCSKAMKSCPICRKPITAKHKAYLT